MDERMKKNKNYVKLASVKCLRKSAASAGEERFFT